MDGYMASGLVRQQDILRIAPLWTEKAIEFHCKPPRPISTPGKLVLVHDQRPPLPRIAGTIVLRHPYLLRLGTKNLCAYDWPALDYDEPAKNRSRVEDEQRADEDTSKPGARRVRHSQRRANDTNCCGEPGQKWKLARKGLQPLHDASHAVYRRKRPADIGRATNARWPSGRLGRASTDLFMGFTRAMLRAQRQPAKFQATKPTARHSVCGLAAAPPELHPLLRLR
jgi:hypothetical protein